LTLLPSRRRTEALTNVKIIQFRKSFASSQLWKIRTNAVVEKVKAGVLNNRGWDMILWKLWWVRRLCK
jgi:hypothetical protein